MHSFKHVLSFLFLQLCVSLGYSQTPFITTWDVDTSLTITVPTTGSGHNYTVAWEKLTNTTINGSSTGNMGNTTITLPEVGIYKLSISGDFPRIYFNNSGDKAKLLTIEQWGSIEWTSMESAFEGCYNLTIPATDAPNLSKVESLEAMFLYCNKINQPIGHWDVSTIKNMSLMFCYANSFNQYIGDWDVSNVTNMTLMFQSAGSFNQDISKWDVSNVTSMYGLFYWPNVFNQDISGWDVSKVTDMSYMFNLNMAFNQDISGWDVSNVTRMSSMFFRATSFSQNIGVWDVSKVTKMDYMFYASGMSVHDYDSTLIGWAAKESLQKNVPLGASGLYYCNSETARETLKSTHNWEISGDSLNCTIAAIDEIEEEEIAIYPNPVIEKVTINTHNTLKTAVEFFDHSGTLILSKAMVTPTETIDMSGFKEGVYLVKIHTPDRTITRQVMKSK